MQFLLFLRVKAIKKILKLCGRTIEYKFSGAANVAMWQDLINALFHFYHVLRDFPLTRWEGGKLTKET